MNFVKHYNNKKEFWLHISGLTVIETERNPCLCCPNSYDETREQIYGKPGQYKTKHIGKYKRSHLLKLMKQNGYERLK